MKELVEVIAKSLVENPEEVAVTERQSGKTTVVELKVAPSDMGKVIGKQGRIAKAIRAVVKAAASKEDKESCSGHSVAEKLQDAALKTSCRRGFVLFQFYPEEKHGRILQVGVITATHGIHGEVKVFPTTDDPKRF